MIDKINKAFKGDLNDSKHLHSNSLCRIAYVGYLSDKIDCKEIAKQMGCSTKSTQERLRKHKFYLNHWPDYKNKFVSLLNDNTAT